MRKEKFLRNLGKMLFYNFDGTLDTDHPTCPDCGRKMKFFGHIEIDKKIYDFPAGEGYWECKNCGFKCTEEDVHPFMRA